MILILGTGQSQRFSPLAKPIPLHPTSLLIIVIMGKMPGIVIRSLGHFGEVDHCKKALVSGFVLGIGTPSPNAVR
jgi:hypothetical protein